MSQIAITGHTYPHREALKAMGGRWNAAEKAWMVPADRADEAKALVAGKAEKPAKSPTRVGRAPKDADTVYTQTFPTRKAALAFIARSANPLVGRPGAWLMGESISGWQVNYIEDDRS